MFYSALSKKVVTDFFCVFELNRADHKYLGVAVP